MISFFFVPFLIKILSAFLISLRLLIPVDIITFFFDFPIFLSKGILVISPEAILIKLTFIFLRKSKLGSSKGLEIKLIFLFLHLSLIFLKSLKDKLNDLSISN